MPSVCARRACACGTATWPRPSRGGTTQRPGQTPTVLTPLLHVAAKERDRAAAFLAEAGRAVDRGAERRCDERHQRAPAAVGQHALEDLAADALAAMLGEHDHVPDRGVQAVVLDAPHAD